MGIDVGDETLMASRSWRWLASRITGLLQRPAMHDWAGTVTFTTRVQQRLLGPSVDASPAMTDAEGGPSH